MTPGRRRLAAVPAVLAVVGGGAVVAWLWAAPAAGWYAPAADDAFAAGDYRTAAVCYARLLQARPRDPATAFDLARSLDAIGQVDAARTLLLRIAPPDAAGGYAPAHLRLAKQDLSSDRPTAAARADARRHLTPVLAAAPDDAEANYWLAVLSADGGDWGKVDAPAARAGPLRDALADRLARLAAAQGTPPRRRRGLTTAARETGPSGSD